MRIIYKTPSGHGFLKLPNDHKKIELTPTTTNTTTNNITPATYRDETDSEMISRIMPPSTIWIPEPPNLPEYFTVDWTSLTILPSSAPVPDITSYKKQIEEQMVVFAKQYADKFLIGIPQVERDSFSAKESAAIAYLAGTADAHQIMILQDEATLTGVTLTVLSNTIKTKAEFFRIVVSKISGYRRSTISAINDPLITTVSQVDQIVDAAIIAADADFQALLTLSGA